MTLTPEQWARIYAGVPCDLRSGRLTKFRSQQFVQTPGYPLLVLTKVSQGIPVTQLGLMRTNSANVRETWGQICKARISAVIMDPDLARVEALAREFYYALYEKELGFTPYDGERDAARMQFRGADPPENIPPVYSDNKRRLIQRVVIDFFVEYEFAYQKIFDTIQKVVVGVSDDAEATAFDWEAVRQTHSAAYLIDVIISE
jgi:hypothetical protein